MATFVLGDIHGFARALKQCLERSQFDIENDQLIFLGDVCDRGPETVECIDILLRIKNLKAIIGNHDKWTMDWLLGNSFDYELWTQHGGNETITSYTKSSNFENIREHHLKEYFNKMTPYFKDDKNRVFLHAGFDWKLPIEETTPEEVYYWDREFFKNAIITNDSGVNFPISNPYAEIYIGHSPTHRLDKIYDGSKPIKFCNVWMMDQGAGFQKYLSMMNIDSKEVFQSDLISKLYK
ncbi:MAG: fructose-bisphosphatase class III [Bacteroidetes bacterium]|nr:fructose-bisphosphatase class III [Bacteroidota bacterium]MDA1120413.1 fructose-bisphosphatase class III [Bacteroidota bacterium]